MTIQRIGGVDLTAHDLAIRAAILRRCQEERWEEPGFSVDGVWVEFKVDRLETISEGRWVFSLRPGPDESATAWLTVTPRGNRISWSMLSSEADAERIAKCAQCVPAILRIVRDAVGDVHHCEQCGTMRNYDGVPRATIKARWISEEGEASEETCWVCEECLSVGCPTGPGYVEVPDDD